MQVQIGPLLIKSLDTKSIDNVHTYVDYPCLQTKAFDIPTIFILNIKPVVLKIKSINITLLRLSL